ncbi:ElyC/SanA/YdcF family protein [Sulfurimonas sp. HSL3-2]|uniref:ElyC/SanA/YdcF family protein n=1 Tax=Hydrocurvibacter mobilis TaxID=3131936 RepID=UPI0031F7F75C
MEFLFFIKKLIAFFVEPFGLVLLLLSLGLYFLTRCSYKKAKLFTTLSFLLLFLFSYPPFSNMLVTNLENRYPKFESTDLNVSYIHVLGNGNNDDYTQPLSSMVSGVGLKRVVEGVIIQKRYPDAKLIFTGYEGGTTLASAVANANIATAIGVKKEMLIINPEPHDTKEEALFTKTLVKEEPFILVTSAAHMPRAMKLFQELGMNPIPAPTDYNKRKTRSLFEAPNIYAFENSQSAVHEYIGMLWAKLVH